MKLIIGLGNPGAEYRFTRHNVGFMAVDHLLQRFEARGIDVAAYNLPRRLKSLAYKLQDGQRRAVIVYPQTFMNLSGEAVLGCLEWFKLKDLLNMIVVHDDIALPLGSLRFALGRGAGGQHGVESIINCLGGRKDFVRIRIGVGPDPGGDRRASIVLAQLMPSELESLALTAERAAEGIEQFIDGLSLDRLMNRFNR